MNGVIATSGGNVSIRGQSAVLDRIPPFQADERAIITTTAAGDSGVASGRVTISTGELDLSRSSINTSGADNTAGAGSAAGEIRITTVGGPILLKGIDARGGTPSSPGSADGDSGAVVLRADTQSVRLGGEVREAASKIHGDAGVSFSGALITRGGDIGISTGPTGEVEGSLGAFGAPTPIVTTAAANSARMPSGQVTISGQLGVTLRGNVVTTGAGNNASTVSAGGNVHISAPGGSIHVWAVDTRDGPCGRHPPDVRRRDHRAEAEAPRAPWRWPEC